MKVWTVAFYNLRVGRPQLVVRNEVEAIMLSDPTILAGCEAIGYRLPATPGYRLLRNTRDQAAANLFAYVTTDLPVYRVRWTKMRRRWMRVKHPRLGRHPGRRILKFRAGGSRWKFWTGVRVSVTHAPQIDPGNTDAARAELLDKLERRMAPWKRPRVWNRLPAKVRSILATQPAVTLWDPNGLGQVLADRVGGRAYGSAVEGIVIRGDVGVVKWTLPDDANGVPLGSDHGRMFRAFVRVGVLLRRADKTV